MRGRVRGRGRGNKNVNERNRGETGTQQGIWTMRKTEDEEN